MQSHKYSIQRSYVSETEDIFKFTNTKGLER